jgi:hypothetical protein
VLGCRLAGRASHGTGSLSPPLGDESLKGELLKMHDEAQMTEDELWVLLGRQLSVTERKAIPDRPEALIERARQWFDSKRSELSDAICSNRQVRELYEHDDMGPLAVAISDLIIGVCIGVSPITVAYLIVRIGVGRLCRAHWADN